MLLSEKKYYPSVSSFIKNHFNCIKTGINRGYISLGLVDVIGVYETSSEYYSSVDLIVIEVKTTNSSFGKSLGQALGYSIYGERCYLGVTFEKDDTFSKEQRYMADHLGVGLIRIPIKKNGKPITKNIQLITSSKKHNPIEGQKQYLLNSVGISRCSSCGLYDETSQMNSMKRRVDSIALFTQIGIRKMYLCRECYRKTISDSEKMKHKKMKEAAQKAIKTKKRRKAAQKAVLTRKKNLLNGKE